MDKSKMLKSTHRPRESNNGVIPAGLSLPPGWTEHRAPTGHLYYFHAQSKQSTYTRPSAPFTVPSSQPSNVVSVPPQTVPQPAYTAPISGHISSLPAVTNAFGKGSFQGPGRGGFRNGQKNHDARRSPEPVDRPRSKHPLPGKHPWLVIRTKFGRRFYYNPEERESFWKAPAELQDAVEAYDRAEKEAPSTSGAEDPDPIAEAKSNKAATKTEASHDPSVLDAARRPDESGSDEYEEVEVTDEEADEGDEQYKRPRLEEPTPSQAQEFNEDDIAFQLQAMGQDYGLDPGEYGEGQEGFDYEEGAEGLPLSEDDSRGLFRDLLDDHAISPFTTWEKIIEEGKIIDDDRYTVLTNMKSRKEVWSEWSRDRIQRAKEEKAKQEKKNPLLPYLDFLEKHATPKLYWPEFKRKYRKEPEMRETKLSDKEREKWYRDYIQRRQLSEQARKADFSTLLKAQPLSVLNNATHPGNLPVPVRADIRYLALDPSIREGLIETYLSTLGPPPATEVIADDEETQEAIQQRADRQRREKALAAREAAVAQEKRRQQGALRYGRSKLQEEEEELQRAMAVGKEGLRAQLGAVQSAEAERHERGG